MQPIDPSQTLARIVMAHPRVAAAFEAAGLDYCCGGATTLEDACRTHELDLHAVVVMLDAAAQADGPEEWTTFGPGRLIDHIVEVHHEPLRAELPRLAQLFDRVVAVHGPRHPELGDIQQQFLALRAQLAAHIDEEEDHLFPMIRGVVDAQHHSAIRINSSDGVTVSVPFPPMINAALIEHVEVGNALADLRAATDDFRPPADACASYAALFDGLARLETDTHLHVHKENNQLFPIAVWLWEQSGELL